jgi:GH15 family glucan-1,4-alpha-glucosidase
MIVLKGSSSQGRFLFLALVCLCLQVLYPQNAWAFQQTPLVTGNGLGFAVVPIKSGAVSKFYAHPYSFKSADPNDELDEGIPSANLIKHLSWGGQRSVSSVEYLNESHVIAVSFSEGGKQYFFMPFGLARNVLIAGYASNNGDSVGRRPALLVQWEHTPRSFKKQVVSGTPVLVAKFEGIGETLLVMPLDAALTGPRQKKARLVDTKGRTTSLGQHTMFAFICLDKEGSFTAPIRQIKHWQKGLGCSKLVNREIKDVESWRIKPTVHFESDKERKLFRQSEIILRMAQCQEENRPDRHGHGLILACLPDGSFVNHWCRDMAYATRALIQMGHQQEARWALEAYFNARPVGKLEKDVRGVPYQISLCRYWGDGSEEPFFTMERATNVEFDDWGLVLWVLGEYIQKFHDTNFLSTQTYRGTILDSAKEFIVKPLLANTDAFRGGLIVTEDTSIWEERQTDKKYFAFSTAAAIKGLQSFAAAVPLKQDPEFHQLLDAKIALLEKGFLQAYAPGRRLRGALQEGIKNNVDGAMLSAINFGIITDRSVITRAVTDMETLRMPSGGFRRMHSIVQDQAIFEYWYERQEFGFIDFSIAEVYLRLGEAEKAAKLIAPIVDKAARDHNIVPEMYVSEVNYRFKGAVGDPTGAVPIVGYGSGTYVSYLYKRDELSAASSPSKP